jgi:peptide/nickel transport system substrate-binding protein
MSQPFWTREFVGLGPYRVDRWEPGAFIEAAAFDGHVLGRPTIDRMRIVWTSDPNTAVANLLSGASHIAIDASIAFQQGLVLKREWTPRNAGSVLMTAAEVRFMHVQHRPEMVNPASIRDVRVRRALAHLMDRQALLDGLLDGEGRVADTLLPTELYTQEVDRAISKYPHDVNRAAQLLTEAGFSRGADGFYTSVEGRFRPEVRTIAGGQIEREMTILADAYRRSGVDAQEFVVPAAQSSDGQVLASFPALFSGKSNTDDTDGGLDKLLSDKIPRADNRWSGSALGGYASTEFDRLYNVFSTALSRAAREQAIVDMSRMVSEELSAIPMYYNFVVQAHTANLQGPREAVSTFGWVHEWQWR